MYCPKCGNEIPDASKFCSNCGAEIVAKKVTSEWEYEDFVIQWPTGGRPYHGTMSIVYTRNHIWNQQQIYIRTELQKCLDRGWESITETGINACEWRLYKKHNFSFGCMEIVGFVITFSLYFWVWLLIRITDPTEYEELVAYRVKMRRPKVSA